MENQVAEFIVKARTTAGTKIYQVKIKLSTLLKQIRNDSFALIRKIMPYVLL
jgi:hypothetical protein